MITALLVTAAGSGQPPKIPHDWPGWLILIALGLLLVTRIWNWLKN